MGTHAYVVLKQDGSLKHIPLAQEPMHGRIIYVVPKPPLMSDVIWEVSVLLRTGSSSFKTRRFVARAEGFVTSPKE